MNHDLVEFEGNILSRTRDAKVTLGGIASVCKCGWVSPYFEKQSDALEAHENHQAIVDDAYWKAMVDEKEKERRIANRKADR